MAKNEYTSPMISVNALYDEDIITASFVEAEIGGKKENVTVGGFKEGWIKS